MAKNSGLSGGFLFRGGGDFINEADGIGSVERGDFGRGGDKQEMRREITHHDVAL